MKLKILGIAMVVALIVQYVIGMASNLFVSFPEKATETQNWEFAWSQIPLALHIILGIGLLVGSIALVIRSILKKEKVWIKASILGLFFILLSGMAGAIFVSKQSDIYSFVMSLGFIGALLSYFWGVYSTK